jgi:hypothetical protein
MPSIRITRKGCPVGVLTIGAEDGAALRPQDGGEAGLAIMAELDGLPVAGAFVPWTDESIDIAELRCLPRDDGFWGRPGQDVLPLWELAGDIRVFRMSERTEFSLTLKGKTDPSLSQLPLNLSIEDEGGFGDVYFRRAGPHEGDYLRLDLDSDLSPGGMLRLQFRRHWRDGFEGWIFSETDAWSQTGAVDISYRFDFEHKLGFGRGRGRLEGAFVAELPLLWLLYEILRRAADPDKPEPRLRLKIGIIGLAAEDVSRWKREERAGYGESVWAEPLPAPPQAEEQDSKPMPDSAPPHWLDEEEGFPIPAPAAAEPPSAAPEVGRLSGVLSWFLDLLPERKLEVLKLGGPPDEAELLNRLEASPPAEAVARAEPVTPPGRPAHKPKPHPVDCTVFAPSQVRRRQSGLLQVFIHAPKQQSQAEAQARAFDGQATARGHRALAMDAAPGTRFGFDVEIQGFELKRRTDALFWDGRPQSVAFPFEVPRFCARGPHTGTVWVSKDGAPAGQISFQIEVAREAGQAVYGPVGDEARHYHACFISYSSEDRAEMLKRVQALRATGLETFVDVIDLRPGDEWNPEIFKAIDGSDLFVLIWSGHARNSKWVLKEARYALKQYKQRHCPDFRPIPVEGPPIAEVPRGLRTYHFNDETLYLIRACEVEALERHMQNRGTR